LKSPEVAAAEPADRRPGLVLFGILDLVFAALFLIRALVFAFVAATGMNPRPEVVLPGELAVWAVVALAVTVFFGAIGVGSITGRRWARSLSLALSSLWLAFGTVTVACLLAAMPRIVSSVGRNPPLGVYAAMAVAGIVLPGAYLLFYRSAGVREACEWLDPEESWTDGLPVVVLAAAMLLVAGAGLALGLGFSAPRQRMFFGDVLELRYRLAFLGAAALQLLLAWGLVRRLRWAWAGAVAVVAIRTVVDFLIVRGLTVDRIERAASSVEGLDARDRAQFDAMRSMHFGGPITAWVVALGVISLAIVIRAGRGLPASPARPGRS